MLASYPHSRATSSTAAIYGGNRRRGGAIAHRDGGIIHGGGRIGRTGGYPGPFMRRLTPQVVAQAGRPHCHQKGPAAQEGVTTTSKRAHARSHWPARTVPGTRTPSSTGPRAQSQAHAHSPAHARTRRPTRAPSAHTTNSKGPASRLTPSSIPSTQCKSPDAFPFPDRSCKRFL